VKVKTFRDLIAWQKAKELAKAVYFVTKTMPADERFGLTNQMRRAAVSVVSNIAEGHARQSRLDYLKFLRTSRGSLAELITQLELAWELNLMPAGPSTADLSAEVDRVLQGLIRALEAKRLAQP
jgi:four helix bundle protein